MSALRRVAVLVAASASTLVLAPAALAKTTTQTASSGGVTATFTFSGGFPDIKNPRLTIVKSGQQLYSQPVTSPQCGTQCGPGEFGKNASSVKVIDLEGNGQPDVILELFTGGANCCFVDQVFSFDPGTSTYVKTEGDFSSGALIKPLGANHQWVFESADYRFKYEFTDGADSGQPIQIWSFGNGQFTDVTRQFRKQISADAARWLRFFNKNLSNGVGLIAAWAADEELLGHDKLVQSKLAFEARKGNLRDGSNGIATGKRFVKALNRFLKKTGYKS
jgi:hypothetical protein